jgi:hypothetical protein
MIFQVHHQLLIVKQNLSLEEVEEEGDLGVFSVEI